MKKERVTETSDPPESSGYPDFGIRDENSPDIGCPVSQKTIEGQCGRTVTPSSYELHLQPSGSRNGNISDVHLTLQLDYTRSTKQKNRDAAGIAVFYISEVCRNAVTG